MQFDLVNPSYISRPVRLSDAKIVADLMNTCSREIIGKDEFTADELENDWQTPGFDLQADSVLVFNDRQDLVAYGDVWGSSAPYTRIFSWVRVHPNSRGKGIGTSLNKWAFQRASEIAQKDPEGAQVVLNCFVNKKDQFAIDLLEELGLKAVRYSWMMETDLNRDLDDVELPGGFMLRVPEPEEYPEVYRVEQESFKDHWGHVDAPFEEGYQQFKNQTVDEPFYNQDFWFVVENDGDMAGMVINTPACSYGDDYGWVHLLGVKRDYRTLGLGKALLLHSLHKLKDAGCKLAGLSVDSESLTGATRLYEKVGMSIKDVNVRYEKVIRGGKDTRTKTID